MKTIGQTIAALGSQEIATRCGVGLTTVSNAKVKGVFPASWFECVNEIAREKGILVPAELFGFKKPIQSKEIDQGIGVSDAR